MTGKGEGGLYLTNAMINRGVPYTSSTPSAPSSRATAAFTDSEPQAAVNTNIVDVTEEGDPWTASSARRVSDLPPLRSSKPAAAKPVGEEGLPGIHKSKKKATKRRRRRFPVLRQQSRRARRRVHLRPPRAKKAVVPTLTVLSAVKAPRTMAKGSRGQDFDLSEFLEFFQPGAAVPASSLVPEASPAQTETSTLAADAANV
ncbi:hypothetical protein PHYBOEH_000341 [Phytophthora boehmeriae]|uniref:Uncharacterized protein n=1 Tax=Phytophthora boehmeriae TaxID=109152 RepID=A0A8T1VAZ1_9STRA|nr:hypothetical protein PHYBOEH_000341 [Phytophthora boehmeriae]